MSRKGWLVLLLVVAAMLGVAGALFDPNLGALVPDLVPADQVQQVTGWMDPMGWAELTH